MHTSINKRLDLFSFRLVDISYTSQLRLVCWAELIECYAIVPFAQLQNVLFRTLVYAQPLLNRAVNTLVINVFLSCLDIVARNAETKLRNVLLTAYAAMST